MRALSIGVVAVLISAAGCRGVSPTAPPQFDEQPRLDWAPDGVEHRTGILSGKLAERAIAARADQVDLHEEEVTDVRHVKERYRDGSFSLVTTHPCGTITTRFFPAGCRPPFQMTVGTVTQPTSVKEGVPCH